MLKIEKDANNLFAINITSTTNDRDINNTNVPDTINRRTTIFLI